MKYRHPIILIHTYFLKRRRLIFNVIFVESLGHVEEVSQPFPHVSFAVGVVGYVAVLDCREPFFGADLGAGIKCMFMRCEGDFSG